MPFDHILGQTTAIETLTRALRTNLVHHAYRFEGIEGVGKERTAFAFAQALLCTGGDPLGCGRCDACRRVVRFGEGEPSLPLHPDVILVGRALYPPDTIGGKKELSEISVEQIRRVVLARASYTPHEGRAQVFIVRGAEQLSISAANALLKTLEEPRPATHFVLLTSQSERLLDTIRSRTLPVRFGPLPDEVVARVLCDSGNEALDPARIDAIVALAGGSARAALDAADPALGDARARFVGAVVAAVRAPDLLDAVELGEAAPRDRHELVDLLHALCVHYVTAARSAPDAATAEASARSHELVVDAVDAIEQRKGSASVVLAGLVASLRHGFQRRPGEKPPIVVTRR